MQPNKPFRWTALVERKVVLDAVRAGRHQPFPKETRDAFLTQVIDAARWLETNYKAPPFTRDGRAQIKVITSKGPAEAWSLIFREEALHVLGIAFVKALPPGFY